MDIVTVSITIAIVAIAAAYIGYRYGLKKGEEVPEEKGVMAPWKSLVLASVVALCGCDMVEKAEDKAAVAVPPGCPELNREQYAELAGPGTLESMRVWFWGQFDPSCQTIYSSLYSSN